MATVTAAAQPINLLEENLGFLINTITSVTSTRAVIDTGSSRSYVLGGSGFTYSGGDNELDSGTVATIRVLLNGSTLLTIGGINRPVSEIYAFLHGGTGGLTSYLLGGADWITGSDYDDTLAGFGGANVIHGGLGADTLYGSYGSSGPSAAERLYGDGGDDILNQNLRAAPTATTIRLDGGDGNDTINITEYGGTNLTVDIFGGMGNDLIAITRTSIVEDRATLHVYGGGGIDTFRSNFFDPGYLTPGTFSSIEVLELPAGTAFSAPVAFINQFQRINGINTFNPAGWTGFILTLSNGGAVDFSQSANSALQLYASNEGNGIIGGSGDDTIYGGTSDDILQGGPGNDLLGTTLVSGATGVDALLGGAGNDYLETQGARSFVADGGSGIDVVRFDLSYLNTGVTLAPAGFASATGVTLGEGAVLRRIEGLAVELTHGDDVFFDSALGGADVVNGRGGSDIVHLSSGIDIAYADSPADAPANDTDVLFVNYSQAASGLNMQHDVFVSSVSQFKFIYMYVFEGNVLNSSNRRVTASNFDRYDIIGSAFSDHLVGFIGQDILRGGEGDDVLSGEFGTDRLIGGGGIDTLRLEFVVSSDGVTPATLASGASIDLALTTAQALPTQVGGESLGSVILSSIENVEGTNLGDTLRGNAGANLLAGRGGNDVLDGREGNDILLGGTGNDTLNGSAGSDTADYTGALAGVTVNLSLAAAQSTVGAGTDTLASIENLLGSSLADSLTGNGSANRLTGAGGKDVLTGGLGGDRFAFDDGEFGGATTTNADRITDFSKAEGDRIDLSLADAKTGTAGDDAFTFIGTTAFGHHAGELRVEVISGNTYVQGDRNGDGGADFMIRLDGVVVLEAGDFVL